MEQMGIEQMYLYFIWKNINFLTHYITIPIGFIHNI